MKNDKLLIHPNKFLSVARILVKKLSNRKTSSNWCRGTNCTLDYNSNEYQLMQQQYLYECAIKLLEMEGSFTITRLLEYANIFSSRFNLLFLNKKEFMRLLKLYIKEKTLY